MPSRDLDPLRDVLLLQERVSRLLEETLAGRVRPPADAAATWTPLADVIETPDGFLLEIELPGVASDDVELVVEPQLVRLSGVRRPRAGARPESFERMERSHGAFARSFRLPVAVDESRTTSRLGDGVLSVELAKRDPGRGKGR